MPPLFIGETAEQESVFHRDYGRPSRVHRVSAEGHFVVVDAAEFHAAADGAVDAATEDAQLFYRQMPGEAAPLGWHGEGWDRMGEWRRISYYAADGSCALWPVYARAFARELSGLNAGEPPTVMPYRAPTPTDPYDVN